MNKNQIILLTSGILTAVFFISLVRNIIASSYAEVHNLWWQGACEPLIGISSLCTLALGFVFLMHLGDK